MLHVSGTYSLYMVNTRDRSITHNVAKMSFDQVLDLIGGVYFYITCDLNLLKPFFFLALSLLKRPTYYRNPPE